MDNPPSFPNGLPDISSARGAAALRKQRGKRIELDQREAGRNCQNAKTFGATVEMAFGAAVGRMKMADHNLEELPKLVAANPGISWADFNCTPVIDFDANGKALTTVRRCAITTNHLTVVVRLPHHAVFEKGAPWPPKAIIDAMMEAVGPTVSA